MSEGIAIIGMAGRFPSAATIDEFWRIAREGGDAMTDFSETELLAAGVSHSALADPRYMRSAPVLDDIAGFDAAFFGFGTEQAELLDPQHRLFFECAWESLEIAGHPPECFKGAIGVFAGCSISSYLLFNLLPNLRAGAAPATLLAMIGNEKDYLASHLAYLLGLTGPSIGVQTACSTSLVAVHLACQSLLSGECDLALAGGANVRVPHRVGYRHEEGSILSATGRCRSFDAAADGTVFGSGVGVVALRRLSDALADSDPIQAVILGSAVNNDGGRKAGYTAPSVDGQAAVIAEALAVAGVDAATIGYIEAHGTGTPIGDPIEIRALNEVFRGLPQGGIALGSVKAAFGHLEAAAGVTGLMAATLAVKEGLLPPIAHFRQANPLLGLEKTPFTPGSKARSWPAKGPRRAGVSSFGIGGTNAHVVIEAPPLTPNPSPKGREESNAPRSSLLCLSARDEAALTALRQRYREALTDEADFPAMCRMAALGRRHFEQRLAVVAESTAEARNALQDALSVRTATQPRLAFLFSGQGSWVAGAGRGLTALPVAGAILERAESQVPGIQATLFDPTGEGTHTELAQPALFALQWALVAQLQAWGIKPVAVTGHSLGELAAAATAGVLDWEAGLQLAAARGRLMQRLPAGGAMAAVFAVADVTQAALGAETAAVNLAAFNAPQTVVLSGDSAALQRVLERLAAQGIAHQWLKVAHAFHSPRMEPILAELNAVATSLTHQASQLHWVSTLTGGVITQPSVDHWSRHARQPVRFTKALETLDSLGCTAFLEIGPGATLTGLTRIQNDHACIVPTLANADEPRALLNAVAALYAHGLHVDWATLLGPGPRAPVPTYPFQHRRYWRDPPCSSNPALTKGKEGAREDGILPGQEFSTPLAQRLFMATVRPTAPDWLEEHRIDEQVILPGAVHAVLALAAGLPGLCALTIEAPLTVGQDGVEMQTILQDGRVQIHARPTGTTVWQRYASAEPGPAPIDLGSDPLADLIARCGTTVSPQTLYQRMEAGGIVLGPRFRRIVEIRAGQGEALARLCAPDDLESNDLPVHPLVLDVLFQTLGAALITTDLPAHLPVALDQLRLGTGANPNTAVWCHATLRPTKPGANGIIGDLNLLAADGTRLLQVEGLGCRPSGKDCRRHLYTPVWRPCDPDHWPKPSTIALQIACRVDLSDYLDYLPQLDALSTAYVARAFIALGARFAVGKPVQLSVPTAPRFTRVLPRLWRMLKKDGLIDADHRTLRIPDANPERRLTEIRARYPAQAPETGMLARCGAALADVLTGTAEPLNLLFAPSEPDDASAVYTESRYASALNELAANALTRALPLNRPLRVLEIGGGTGGTTRHLLPIFPTTTAEYRFTDLSPAFLPSAEQTFAKYPFLRTALLDIEQELAAQGVEASAYDLVIAANVLHAARDLGEAVAHAAEALTPGGWLLLIEGLRPSRWLDLTFGLTEGWQRGTDRKLRPDDPLIDAGQWRQLLTTQGFDDVAALTPGSGRLADQGVILARKSSPAPAQTVICRAALDTPLNPAAAVLPVLQTELGQTPRLLVATYGAQRLRLWETPDSAQAAVLGLTKAAALEYPGTQVRLVDLDPLDDHAEATLAAESAIGDGESEVAWRDGQRYALRLTRTEDEPLLPERFRLTATEPGQLDYIAPTPLPEQRPGPGEVEIAVAAAGLNFKDVLTVLNLSPRSLGEGVSLGGECAGTIAALGEGVTEFQIGDRVLALAGSSLASHVIAPVGRVARIPKNLTCAQAAALPVAASTAWYALRELGRVQAGHRVLIHAATGGVGGFAVALARAVGAEVLATAGSSWKRAWLQQIGIQHVFDSRNPGFAAEVMAATAGAGVDLVLNSLTGDLIPASLSVLKPGGRFIEIGRAGIWSAEQVAARFPTVDYRIVALDTASEAEGGRLLRAVLDAVASGELPPPPLNLLPMSRAAEAFRLMQQARHLGKIVLTHHQPFHFRPDRGYLITGGLGGLGLAVAQWAVSQGAKYLALVSRHAPDAQMTQSLEKLREQGATVQCIAADLADETQIHRMLAELHTVLPPLAGVFHAAGLLDDAPLAEQTPKRLAKVAGPKLTAIPHLATLNADLDAFVLFSSAAGLLGSPGQANHAAASTGLDALAQRYQAQGLPVMTIDWGAWRDVGAAARRQVGERLAETGMGALTTDEGLAALAWTLERRPSQIAVLPIDWPKLQGHFGTHLPALFRELSLTTHPAPTQEKGGNPPFAARCSPLATEDLAALPPARQIERIAGLVEAQARGLLSIGNAPLRHDRPLNELGLDSLLAVELRNRLGALAGASLPATLLFNYPTIAALAEHLAMLMALDSWPEPVSTAPTDEAEILEDEDILSLDEDDLDAILRNLEQRHLQ
ncbi:MAG: SDR family NAD(P)-dependent oxidoreductase [Gammaproteobacteria bacterium]|nr:SDR family NAD(P)-dependent oxidoreductase [Gammaproteobacteria bacterium]HRX71168.1 SDR family NAD(P)-dependent oxidoreductase [Candidatus Competibacteraceae bacterium]